MGFWLACSEGVALYGGVPLERFGNLALRLANRYLPRETARRLGIGAESGALVTNVGP